MKLCPFAVLALLGGCALSDPSGPSAGAESELARALEGRVAREPISCVSLRDLGGNRSIGDQAIVFGGPGGRIYVNRPPAGCPTLSFGRALRIETMSGQLCRGDIVMVFDPATGGDYGGCGLGGFTPYDRVR